MSGAAQFPNRLCARGSRLHRSESLRHSDSESSFASENNSASSPADSEIVDVSQESVGNDGGDEDGALHEDADIHRRNANDIDRASLVDSEYESDHDPEVDRTPPALQGTLTERQLRESLQRLQQNLNTSTAIMNNLQTREKFYRLDRSTKKAEARRLREIIGKAKRAVDRERALKSVLMIVLCAVVLMLAAYCYVAWVRGPEMEYVRKRRAEILLE